MLDKDWIKNIQQLLRGGVLKGDIVLCHIYNQICFAVFYLIIKQKSSNGSALHTHLKICIYYKELH